MYIGALFDVGDFGGGRVGALERGVHIGDQLPIQEFIRAPQRRGEKIGIMHIHRIPRLRQHQEIIRHRIARRAETGFAEIPDQVLHVGIGVPEQRRVNIKRQAPVVVLAQVPGFRIITPGGGFRDDEADAEVAELAHLVRQHGIKRRMEFVVENIEFITVDGQWDLFFRPFLQHRQRLVVDLALAEFVDIAAIIHAVFDEFQPAQVGGRRLDIALVGDGGRFHLRMFRPDAVGDLLEQVEPQVRQWMLGALVAAAVIHIVGGEQAENFHFRIFLACLAEPLDHHLHEFRIAPAGLVGTPLTVDHREQFRPGFKQGFRQGDVVRGEHHIEPFFTAPVIPFLAPFLTIDRVAAQDVQAVAGHPGLSFFAVMGTAQMEATVLERRFRGDIKPFQVEGGSGWHEFAGFARPEPADAAYIGQECIHRVQSGARLVAREIQFAIQQPDDRNFLLIRGNAQRRRQLLAGFQRGDDDGIGGGRVFRRTDFEFNPGNLAQCGL